MTDEAREIAGKLSEAQKRAVTRFGKIHRQTARTLVSRGLAWMDGGYVRSTPLGLAVRAVLMEGRDG